MELDPLLRMLDGDDTFSINDSIPGRAGTASSKPDATRPVRAIVLDGWSITVDEGEPRVRDLDLADKAGLAKARDIRQTIRKAVEDKALTELRGGVAAAGTPAAWVEDEVVSGNAAKVYYLNEEGALLVLTRLRTPAAIAATRSLVMVCAAARRGELAQPTKAPPPPLPGDPPPV